jgi:hypothetical protein
MKEFLISVERGSQGAELASFLCGCRAQPRLVDEHGLAADLDQNGCPGLATLVAAAEQCRRLGECG